MTIKQHFVKNISLAYPVMIGQLGHIMVSVADSVMVGRVGVIPLASATFASTIFTVLMLFGIGVSYAITPLVASTNKEDKPRILQFLQDGFLLCTVLGLALALVGFLTSYFLDYFGQDPAVAAEAKSYVQIMSASIFPLMVYQAYRQYAEGLSDTMNPMVVSVVSNLANVGMNYIFIFGHFGFEPMGLFGAGLSTLISRSMMPVMMILLIRKKMEGFHWHFEWPGIKRMLKIGVPSGMQYVFEVGAFAAAGIMIGWLGPVPQAAHNIALNLSAITYMAATGIAAAGTIRVSNQLMEKDRANLRLAGFTSFWLGAIWMSLAATTFILLRHVLPALYVPDLDVQRIAAALLIVGAAFQISDGLQAVGLGVLRGLKDVRVPTMVTFVAYWVLAIPLAYIMGFVFDMGVMGVWYALSIGLTVAAVLHIWRFNVLSKKVKF
jgi:multidrug resistance protein, MATE family